MTDNRQGPPEVGSVAEEAAKLIGALSGWAREQGDGLADAMGHGVAEAAHGVSGAAHNVNEHLATGGEECTYCPVCRGIHFVRSTSPEVKAHLASAASSLLQAAAGLMATQVPDPGTRTKRPATVEHIDLDAGPDQGAGWPDEEGDES